MNPIPADLYEIGPDIEVLDPQEGVVTLRVGDAIQAMDDDEVERLYDALAAIQLDRDMRRKKKLDQISKMIAKGGDPF